MTLARPHRRRLLSGLLASPLVPAPARSQPGWGPWPSGARGAVSLTYDDGLDSHLDQVIPDLNARGLRGTFFLVRDNVDERIGDWVKAAEPGHEIGNHTVSHQCSLGGFTEAGFADREIEPMEDYLDQHFGPRPMRLYAYPCGFLGLGRGDMRARFGRYRLALQDAVTAARTVAGPPNDPFTVRSNRLDLSAFEPTYDTASTEPARRYLDAALARGGWAILVFHDVLPQWRAEGDTAAAVHSRVLDLIADRPLWCAPMGEVFTRLTGDRGPA
ncbi:MAG TPA: polysaccharide deacetylase family protein [Caulobacteraceae bacterium]|nr:polysaccharide deacetylase family protein [Caulobacteraceae bacterium]